MGQESFHQLSLVFDLAEQKQHHMNTLGMQRVDIQFTTQQTKLHQSPAIQFAFDTLIICLMFHDNLALASQGQLFQLADVCLEDVCH